MAHLKHDHRDIGKVFKKVAWGTSNSLIFSWCEEAGYYGYCSIDDEGDIVFRPPHHTINRKLGYKVSRVGDGVLECAMVLVTTIKKENKMKNVNYIGGKYNVVSAVGMSDPLYIGFYKIDADIKVEKDDLIVVETGYGLEIVTVIEFYERSLEVETMKIFNNAIAWVVDKIDESRQKQRREATERRKFITKQLEEKKEAMEEIAIYKMLAESDPDAAKLLEELKQLGQ